MTSWPRELLRPITPAAPSRFVSGERSVPFPARCHARHPPRAHTTRKSEPVFVLGADLVDRGRHDRVEFRIGELVRGTRPVVEVALDRRNIRTIIEATAHSDEAIDACRVD